MNSILDRIASSPLLMILLCCVLLLVGIFVGMKFNPFKKKKSLSTIYLMALVFLACTPIFIFTSSKLGLATDITDIKLINDKICFLDYKIVADDYGTYDKYKFYVVDSKSGELIDKTLLGYDVVWLTEKNNLILFQESKKYILYDLDKCEVKLEISNDYLSATFPELSAGIESVIADKNCLTILAKDGRSYIYDAFSDEINVPCRSELIPIVSERYSYYYDKIYITENGQQFELFTFSSKNPNDVLKHIESIPKNKDEEIFVSQDAFISGYYLDIFEDKNMFLVMSYATTDKTEYLITAINFNLETIWKLDYATLDPKDFYTKGEPLPTDFIEIDDNIVFGIGGFLYCVDAVSGNIIWKKRV